MYTYVKPQIQQSSSTGRRITDAVCSLHCCLHGSRVCSPICFTETLQLIPKRIEILQENCTRTNCVPFSIGSNEINNTCKCAFYYTWISIPDAHRLQHVQLWRWIVKHSCFQVYLIKAATYSGRLSASG